MGADQTARVTEQLPDSIQVEVRDGAGTLVPNLTVGFVVLTEGGGEPFLPTVLTNSVGQATNFWTLGTKAGAHMMEVRAIIDNVPTILDTVRAVATPDSPDLISVVSGDVQTTDRGQVLPESLVVSVVDQFGNGVSNTPIDWVVMAGAGTVGPTATVTDAIAEAKTSWTLGSVAGENIVEAQVVGLTAVTLTATGTASWTQITTATSPSARCCHGMIYDAARDRIVIFGGSDGSFPRFNDTWEFDGVSWGQISTATAPPPREFPGMAYDLARSRIVLFGGSPNGGAELGDTWEYDGINWTEVTTPTSPPARRNLFMIYDALRSRIVLFGGVIEAIGLVSETWEYDGTDWVEMVTLNKPSPRASHSMVYDPMRNRTVLFGGSTNDGDSDETWEYDGNNWILVNTPTSPPARDAAHAMAYLDGAILLYGGSDQTNVSLGDTWRYDGTDWSEVPISVSPDPLILHAIAQDTVREQLILFGGRNGAFLADTWIYPQ